MHWATNKKEDYWPAPRTPEANPLTFWPTVPDLH